MGHAAKDEADSSAALRNDNLKAKAEWVGLAGVLSHQCDEAAWMGHPARDDSVEANAKEEADSSAALRNDNLNAKAESAARSFAHDASSKKETQDDRCKKKTQDDNSKKHHRNDRAISEFILTKQ